MTPIEQLILSVSDIKLNHPITKFFHLYYSDFYMSYSIQRNDHNEGEEFETLEEASKYLREQIMTDAFWEMHNNEKKELTEIQQKALDYILDFDTEYEREEWRYVEISLYDSLNNLLKKKSFKVEEEYNLDEILQERIDSYHDEEEEEYWDRLEIEMKCSDEYHEEIEISLRTKSHKMKPHT